MIRISVFCGSSTGNKQLYSEATKNLADTLISNNLSLIYGGGKIGLMGILANRMLEQNGEVIGIIPHFLFEKEVGHQGLTELIKVNSMHERKALIQEKSDGFIALPGGFGTVEEIFEMITWGQLNIHKKPCAFLNVNGYYDFIDDFINNCITEGFIDPGYKDMIVMEDDPEIIIQRFKTYEHHRIDKSYLALNNKSLS